MRRDINNFQPVNLGKGITSLIKIKYFPLHGRADPLVQMFEYHGQPYEKINIEQMEWSAQKGRPEAGEFNSLPMIEIESRGQVRELGQV